MNAAAKPIAIIPTIGENININWSPDGKSIAVGNRDDQLTLIDAQKYKMLRTMKYTFEVNEVTWDATGELFFITTGLGKIEITNPELKPIITLHAAPAALYCIDFDSTGK